MILTNRTIKTRDAIIGWMARDLDGFNAVVLGIGKVETITAGRMNNILAAHEDGIELPAIQFAPQFGEIIDGRHRVAVAYLLGIEEIAADLHYC